MSTLLVYAHPATDGHCSFMLQQVEAQLKTRNINYELIDLYQENYDPVLRENEHYTAGNSEVSARNLELQEKIKQSDLFVYPVWWGSMPAILKGFIDRVFTAGFGFYYDGSIPKALLKGKKAMVFMTSGSPKFYSLLTGNVVKKLIKRHILEFCGIKTKVFHIGSCRQLDASKQQQISKLIKKAFRCFCS